MNRGNMISATEYAKSRVESIISRAKIIERDELKQERINAQECKSCFYQDRIGGAAITDRECMCCGKIQQYGSTATNALCKPCATKHSLCKHCGGDVELRVRRRKWPEPENGDNNGTTS